VGSLAERARASAWAPLVAKAMLALGGFAALAFVGSGAAADLLPSEVGGYLGPAPTAAAQVPPAHVNDAGAPPPAPAPVPAPAPSSSADAGADAAPPAAAITPDGKVILNLASEEDLRKLPGIGATRAKAILALRDKMGRFKRPEDLLRVKGIGRKKLAKLRPHLLIDPPP
jgi:competence protein ComEA